MAPFQLPIYTRSLRIKAVAGWVSQIEYRERD